jgi:hypothetical protein
MLDINGSPCERDADIAVAARTGYLRAAPRRLKAALIRKPTRGSYQDARGGAAAIYTRPSTSDASSTASTAEHPLQSPGNISAALR